LNPGAPHGAVDLNCGPKGESTALVHSATPALADNQRASFLYRFRALLGAREGNYL